MDYIKLYKDVENAWNNFDEEILLRKLDKLQKDYDEEVKNIKVSNEEMNKPFDI